jgi:hypothetical protein
MTNRQQDPDDRLDWAFDFKARTHGTGASDWLEDGETITDSTVTSDNAEFIIGNITQVDGLITYWASGGVDGKAYKVTCHVTTSSGREKDVSDYFYIKST